MASEHVLIDDLAYVDQDVLQQEGMKQRVQAEIERECASFTPASDYLSHLEPVRANWDDVSSLLGNELRRMDAGMPFEKLDMTRYSCHGPAHADDGEEAWRAAVHNAWARQEDQNLRAVNLSLLKLYGSQAWMQVNSAIEAEVARKQAQLQQIKDEVALVQRKRRQLQQEAGIKLRRLDSEYTAQALHNAKVASQLQRRGPG